MRAVGSGAGAGVGAGPLTQAVHHVFLATVAVAVLLLAATSMVVLWLGFATVRGGDIIGEHTALFAGAGERIEIAHKSSSRANYADGSLRAARFLVGRAPGLYGMDDVLDLK